MTPALILTQLKGISRMRMVVYALSAACGCAPAGYTYYRNYYPVAPIEYRSPSEWGGDSALPFDSSFPYRDYISPYYVGSPYPSYGSYYYVMDTHRKIAAAKRPPAAKVAAKVPLPKPRPAKIVAKLPPHTKAVVD